MTIREKTKHFQTILTLQTSLTPSQSEQKKYQSSLKSSRKKFQSPIGDAVDLWPVNLKVLADSELQKRPKYILGQMVFFLLTFDTLSKSSAIQIDHRSAHLFSNCHKKRKCDSAGRESISRARIDCWLLKSNSKEIAIHYVFYPESNYSPEIEHSHSILNFVINDGLERINCWVNRWILRAKSVCSYQ